MQKKIIKAFEDSIAVKQAYCQSSVELILEISTLIADAFTKGKRLFLIGNGGSACDASHIAAEFVNRFKKDRPGLPAIALNTDMAVITSISNDYDYSDIFARQVRTLADEGDILIAISTSGGSKNILKAVDVAKKKGLVTIAFTGLKGEKFASKCDYAVVAPSEDTPRIQELHITVAHIICQIVEELIFELPRKKTSA